MGANRFSHSPGIKPATKQGSTRHGKAKLGGVSGISRKVATALSAGIGADRQSKDEKFASLTLKVRAEKPTGLPFEPSVALLVVGRWSWISIELRLTPCHPGFGKQWRALPLSRISLQQVTKVFGDLWHVASSGQGVGGGRGASPLFSLKAQRKGGE